MTLSIAQFQKQNYLNIETFRKSGEGVKTPVWFVLEGDVLYIRTQKGSGKVKRVRNNPRVRVVPCTMNGDPRGEWMEATASLLGAEDDSRIDQLLNKKYGLTKKVFDLFGRMGSNANQGDVVIRVDLKV